MRIRWTVREKLVLYSNFPMFGVCKVFKMKLILLFSKDASKVTIKAFIIQLYASLYMLIYRYVRKCLCICGCVRACVSMYIYLYSISVACTYLYAL